MFQSTHQNHKMINKLLKYIRENKLILFLFVIATTFFVYQHAISISWDFGSYVLNAKYWFADGKYFEPSRPPLMPFIIGLLGFLSWRAAEYIYIILASFLFMYSSARLAKSFRFDPLVFYAISLNAFLLDIGLINGTELLSLIFLELFLTFLIENRSFSGVFLALSALSRYTGLALFPIIFMHLEARKILKSLALFGATLSLWLIYNFYRYGNFFTSIADGYAINISYRDYMVQPMQPLHFLQVQNILVPFFLIGVIVIAYQLFCQIKAFRYHKLRSFLDLISRIRIELIMFFLLLSAITSYNSIPLKDVRYLFNLVLPTFYFSYVGLSIIVKKICDNRTLLISIAMIIFIINISFVLVQIPHKEYETPQRYNPAISKLDEFNLSDCSVMSNSWVILNYLGQPSLPALRIQHLNRSIEQGQTIVLFKHVGEPDYVQNDTFIKSLPVIYEDSGYVIIGLNRSLPATVFDDTYLQQIDEVTSNLYGYHINQNPCFILFNSYPSAEKSCNLINLKGFKQDEYRRSQ
jgi:hypothetical protein